jgi:hypothetical protein
MLATGRGTIPELFFQGLNSRRASQCGLVTKTARFRSGAVAKLNE